MEQKERAKTFGGKIMDLCSDCEIVHDDYSCPMCKITKEVEELRKTKTLNGGDIEAYSKASFFYETMLKNLEHLEKAKANNTSIDDLIDEAKRLAEYHKKSMTELEGK